MSKEITKAIILQEIQDKFKMREFEPAPFLFDETVVPTYDIRSHLGRWETKYASTSITSAAGFAFFTVPAYEQWFLRRYDIIFMGAGAIKVTGLYVKRAESEEACYLDMKKEQDVSYHIDLIEPVFLHPGDKIYVLIDTYVSTQDLRVYIDYLREQIR